MALCCFKSCDPAAETLEREGTAKHTVRLRMKEESGRASRREGVSRIARTSLAAVAIIAALNACGGPSEEELRNGARALLPPGSIVLEEVAGNCVELASSPSCVQVYFVVTGDPDRRAEAVIERARSSGWEVERRELLPGGTELRVHADELTAIVSLQKDDVAERCAATRIRACADTVMVEGIYGI
jgi:hypothetical protein